MLNVFHFIVILLFYACVLAVVYRVAVSAHASLVVLLVFIDTYIVFILLVLEQIS